MKKPIVIAIVIGFLGLGITGGYLWTKRKPQKILQVSPEEVQAKLLDWKDPNGFSFQYPEGVVIDKHDEDKQNYAHIEMTNPQNPGSLIVWAKDTTAADVTAWVKTEKTFTNASIVDTTLGGKPAKKIFLSGKNVTVGTIFDGIVWYIEAGEDEYWQRTLDTIARSFTFTPLPGESGGSSYEEVAVDEEEFIE